MRASERISPTSSRSTIRNCSADTSSGGRRTDSTWRNWNIGLGSQAGVRPGPTRLPSRIHVLDQGISGRVLRRAKRRGRARPAGAEQGERAPVATAHREDLEAHMDLLRMAVELEGPCDFGDAPGAEPYHREAFLAHFGELEDEL